jgi:uncharacterized protein YbjT (DUF2867 family)
MNNTTLVTGATGNVGAHVVRQLRARGVPVRAFVRDADKAAATLPRDVDLAVGDFTDSESIRTALKGVTGVCLISPSGPEQVGHEIAVIYAAAAAGVSRLVKVSVVGADPAGAMPGQQWHGRIEEYLRRTSIPAIVLQPNWFMSNLLILSAEQIRHTGKIFAPAGGGKVSMIDPIDIAAAAAAVLTTDGHEGKAYELTGEQAITHDDMATELSAVTRRPVEFVDMPEDAARTAFTEAGLPDWLVTHLMRAFALMREGALGQTTTAVRDLTGRPARTFADFAHDHAAFFTA